jgi:hypothetical protein
MRSALALLTHSDGCARLFFQFTVSTLVHDLAKFLSSPNLKRPPSAILQMRNLDVGNPTDVGNSDCWNG